MITENFCTNFRTVSSFYCWHLEEMYLHGSPLSKQIQKVNFIWVMPLEVTANKTAMQSIPNAGFTIECTSLYLDSSFISSSCSLK